MVYKLSECVVLCRCCVCMQWTHSSSSFHPCIILNRHIKCNYKMSISVSTRRRTILCWALWSSKSLQFTAAKDKHFATWLFYLIVYTISLRLTHFTIHIHTKHIRISSENGFDVYVYTCTVCSVIHLARTKSI